MDPVKTLFVVAPFRVDHEELVSAPVSVTATAGLVSTAITMELGSPSVPLIVHTVSRDAAQHWESTSNEQTLNGHLTAPPTHVVVPVQFMGALLYQLEVWFLPSLDKEPSFDFALHVPPTMAPTTASGAPRRRALTGEYQGLLVPALRPDTLDLPLQPCGYPFVFESPKVQYEQLAHTITRLELISALVQWIIESYYERSQTNIGCTIGTFSDRLKFEFDSFLCAVGRGCASLQEYPLSDPERPLYAVRPTSSGTQRVVLELPLLLDQQETIRLHSDIAIDHFRKLNQQPSLQSELNVAMSWRYRVEIEAGKGLFHVISEHISLRIEGDGVWSTFLMRLVNLKGSDDSRPPSYAQYSAQRNATLMEFVPELESWLLRTVEEPQHFLELVHSLTQTFGLPIQWNVMALSRTAVQNNIISCPIRDQPQRGSPSSSDKALPKFATFLCMDRSTSTSFTLQMAYNGRRRPPELTLQSTMHILSSNNRPLRVNIALPESAARFDVESGSYDVIWMADAIQAAVLSRFADVQRVIDTLRAAPSGASAPS